MSTSTNPDIRSWNTFYCKLQDFPNLWRVWAAL